MRRARSWSRSRVAARCPPRWAIARPGAGQRGGRAQQRDQRLKLTKVTAGKWRARFLEKLREVVGL
jgi:hypothetical protein